MTVAVALSPSGGRTVEFPANWLAPAGLRVMVHPCRRNRRHACLPTQWNGATVLRMAFVNPGTRAGDIIDTLRQCGTG